MTPADADRSRDLDQIRAAIRTLEHRINELRDIVQAMRTKSDPADDWSDAT